MKVTTDTNHSVDQFVLKISHLRVEKCHFAFKKNKKMNSSIVCLAFCLFSAVMAAPSPPTRPSSPIASDFWTFSGRRPTSKLWLAYDDTLNDNSMNEYISCIPNIINSLVKEYDSIKAWDSHQTKYTNTLQAFNTCTQLGGGEFET